MLIKIVSKFSGKLQKVMKLGKKLSKTRKRLSSGKISVSFRTILEKFENQQKTLGK